MKGIEEFAATLGPQAEGVQDILNLLKLAEGYGIADWVQFDASVVRGLAYYTGTSTTADWNVLLVIMFYFQELFLRASTVRVSYGPSVGAGAMIACCTP